MTAFARAFFRSSKRTVENDSVPKWVPRGLLEGSTVYAKLK
jgi:hypothetical protein